MLTLARIGLPFFRGTLLTTPLYGTIDLELKPSPNSPPPVFADLQNLSEMLRAAKGSPKFDR